MSLAEFAAAARGPGKVRARLRHALSRLSREHVSQSAWALFGLIGPSLMQLLFVVVAARALRVDDFGRLMLCVATANIVMTLSGIGSGGVAMKAIARAPDQAARHFGQTLLVTAWTAPVLVPVSVGVTWFVAREQLPWALMICVALSDVVLGRVATTCQQVFIGLGQQPRGARVGMIMPSARVVAAILVMLRRWEDPLAVFALAYLVATILATACAILYTVATVGRPVLRLGRMRFDEGISFALLWLNNTVQVECDKLILSWFVSLADVGTYSLASRLMDGAFSPPRALKNVLQARMFRTGAAGHGAIFRLSLRILPAVAAYGLVVWIVTWVAAPWVVVLFGERYSGLVAILPLFGALPLLRSISDIGGEVFIASDHVMLSTGVQVLATLIRIGVGIVLVQAAGLHGAVAAALIATLLAGAIFWGASWLLDRRRAGA